MNNVNSRRHAAFAFCTVVLLSTMIASGGAAPTQVDDEQQVGQEVFNELKAKGEIVASSPLYDVLTPIVEPIARTAQPRYKHPFKFYLVHEQSPNAFSVPGGNVYVTDSLLFFVKNTEELAGTLCHEVSHTIHHDSMALLAKERKIERREVGAAILLGPSVAHVLAITLIGKLHSLSYSREAESAADITGSDICAATGDNPWGLVWLFKDFDAADLGQVPQILSDHPDNPHRVEALTQHFAANPSVFAKYPSNPKTAKPMVLPANATETFLR
jgi:predicted Zn-dependent protease